MARIHYSGFMGDLTTVGKCEWANISGTPSQINPGLPRGQYAMRITSLVSGARQAVASRTHPTAPLIGTKYLFRFYFRLITAPTANNYIFTISSVAPGAPTALCPSLKLTSARQIIMGLGTSQNLWTSAAITLNTWVKVELSFMQDGTDPGNAKDFYHVRITSQDGTPGDIMDIPAPTATLAAAATMRGFGIGGNLNQEAQTTGVWDFADFAMNDSTTHVGNTQIDYPPDARITYLRPDAPGTHNETSPQGAATNFDCVKELVPDLTTTHALGTVNSANVGSAGSRISVNLTDCASAGIASGDSISLIAVGVAWAGAAAGACGIQTFVRSAGANLAVSPFLPSSGISDIVNTGGNTAHYSPSYVNTGGSVPWSISELDAIEAGAFSPDTTPNTKVSTLWLAVEYVPGVAGPAGNQMATIA